MARSTVYLVFESWAGLFEALVRDLIERAAYAKLLEAVSHPDALEHLRGGIRAGAEMFATEHGVYRALHSMAPLEPDSIGAAVRATDEERWRGMTRVAGRLREQGLLAPGLTEELAAQMLWTITSFEAFDVLYTGRGLSLEEAGDVLVEMAERAVVRTA